MMPSASTAPLAAAQLAAVVAGAEPWPIAVALPEGVGISQLLVELRRLSWAAADILLAYGRGEQPPYGFPAALSVDDGGEGPVTAADLAVNQWLLEGLQASFPDAGWTLLSEETAKDQLRAGEPLAAQWLWILDPLDGTKDFLQGTGEYAVHLALVRGEEPVLGVVLLPEKGELWIGVINADGAPQDGLPTAALPGVAWGEDRAGNVFPVAFSSRRERAALVLVASRNHRDQRLEQLLAALALGDTKAIGIVGGKVATILRG